MAFNFNPIDPMGVFDKTDTSNLDQIPGVEKAYDPYRGYGEKAGGILSNQFGDMSQDPQGFINKMMQSYRNTPGFQQRLSQSMNAAGNTAAAGGRTGTLGDIKNQAGLEDQLLGQDMQQWLDNVLGVQRTGLQGEKGMYDTGFNATQDYVGDMTNYYGQKQQVGMADKKMQMDFLMNALKALASQAGGSGA